MGADSPVKVLRTNKTLSSAVRQRHPWVFRDALPKKIDLPEACFVRVLDKSGHYLGDGLYETSGEIAVRFWNYNSVASTPESIANAVQQSIDRRRIFGHTQDTNALRLVHGENDGCPGLVIDSYAGHVVVQFHSGAAKKILLPRLRAILSRDGNRSISIKDTSTDGGGLNAIQGLVPAEIKIREGDCDYLINVWEGQKTGFYLDLRSARLLVRRLVKPGARFLNLFGYTGAFTLQALKGGAARTVTVDQSQQALDMLGKQLEINGLNREGAVTVRAEDVRDVLKDFSRKKQLFDFVICDPPSFIHNKSQKSKGWDAYVALYAQALAALENNGVVGIGNCSAQISPSEFELLVEQAAAEAGCALYRVFDIGQPPDHPVRVGFSEGRYLNFQFFVKTAQ